MKDFLSSILIALCIVNPTLYIQLILFELLQLLHYHQKSSSRSMPNMLIDIMIILFIIRYLIYFHKKVWLLLIHYIHIEKIMYLLTYNILISRPSRDESVIDNCSKSYWALNNFLKDFHIARLGFYYDLSHSGNQKYLYSDIHFKYKCDVYGNNVIAPMPVN